MAMTTADARLAYDYALREAALKRIRRLERVGYAVRWRYIGENRIGEVKIERHADEPVRRRYQLTITLSRYTNRGLMERMYDALNGILASLLEKNGIAAELRPDESLEAPLLHSWYETALS